MRVDRAVACAILLLHALCGAAHAATYTVGTGDETYATVALALAACDSDSSTVDTILVSAGTYNDGTASGAAWKIGVNLVGVAGETVILKDTNLAGKRFATVTDCGYGIVFQNITFEDYNAVGAAATDVNFGGAFLIYNTTARSSLVSFIDCTFDNCDAGGTGIGKNSGNGGAIYAADTDGHLNLTLDGCTFIDCTTTHNAGTDIDMGGAVSAAMLGGSVTVTDCTFGTAGHGNAIVGTTEDFQLIGGGLKTVTTRTSVTNCTFTANSAEYGGALSLGGLSNTYSYDVVGCTFTGNTAATRGGAVLFEHGGPYTFLDCVFTGNTTTSGYAGALSGHYTTLTLDGCEFYGNSATDGGAIVCGGAYGATPVIGGYTYVSGCIFQGNEASGDGGVMFVPSASAVDNTLDIGSSIFVDNTAGDEGAHIYYVTPGFGKLNLAIRSTIIRLGNADYGIGTNAPNQTNLVYAFTCLDTVAAGTAELLENTPNATAETVCTDCISDDPSWCDWTDDDTENDDFTLNGESPCYGTATCGQIGPYWCDPDCGTGCWAPGGREQSLWNLPWRR